MNYATISVYRVEWRFHLELVTEPTGRETKDFDDRSIDDFNIRPPVRIEANTSAKHVSRTFIA